MDSESSPWLVTLQQDLQNAKPEALLDFWNELAQKGAPLVEPLENEPEMSLVTFLWRSRDELKNVLFASHLTAYDMRKGLMTHLANTDLWYITFKIANNVRTTYHFAPNDSLIPVTEDPDILPRLANMHPDPFNPKRYFIPKDESDPKDFAITYSLLEMPKAKPQPWSAVRPGTPAGKVEMHRFRSTILNNERRVWIYTPPDYNPQGHDPAGEPYPLLLFFDGQAYTSFVNTPVILDNLLADGLIPPFVAVFPESLDGETRSRELPCYSPFAKFLAQELLPWAHEKALFTDDPRWTFVGGSSYGALAASFAALQYPEIFGNVISQSGSYWWRSAGTAEDEWLIRQYALTQRLSTHFYMDVGLMETVGVYEFGPNQRLANRHMRDVLQAKGYSVHYSEYNGGHEYCWWQGTLADGLLALLEGRRRKGGKGDWRK